MFFKKEKEKKMNVPDLWNFMTSLNKKDKALFEELLDNDNDFNYLKEKVMKKFFY